MPEPIVAPEEQPQEAVEATPVDLTRKRDDEVIPAARELIARLVVRSDLMMGSNATINPDAAAQYYQKVYREDLVPLLRRYNLKIDDVKFLFSIILQPFQFLADVTNASFTLNESIANAKLWGVKDMADLRIGDLEAVLMEQKGVPEEKTGDNATGEIAA